MRFPPEALVLLLGAAVAGAQVSEPSPTPSPSPAPSALPSPTVAPAAKLLPYWYETEAERSRAPLLHFEDRAEVRALEMNAAIARFFDPSDETGDMTRGATTGGAPTLGEMKNYRPHASPSLDFLSLAKWAASLGKGAISRRYRSRVERNEELLRALLLGEYPAPGPDPAASPTPSPSPSPSSSSNR